MSKKPVFSGIMRPLNQEGGWTIKLDKGQYLVATRGSVWIYTEEWKEWRSFVPFEHYYSEAFFVRREVSFIAIAGEGIGRRVVKDG